MYHERMKLNNTINKDIKIDDNFPMLSYETSQKKAIRVSIVANLNSNMMNKHVTIKCPTSSSPHVPVEHSTSVSPHGDDIVINIQLPYDPNALTKPNLWDSNFHPILLYDSIKYLASDLKNIKDLLNFMAKYITNKQIDLAKSNDLEDFNGIREAIWNLISFIYQFKQNLLIADHAPITIDIPICEESIPNK